MNLNISTVTVDPPLWNSYALCFAIPSTASYPVQVDMPPALAFGLFAVAVSVVVIPAEHSEADASEAEAVPTSSFPASAAMEGSINSLSPFSPPPSLPPHPSPPSANPRNRFRFSLAYLSLLLSSSFPARTSKLTSSGAFYSICGSSSSPPIEPSLTNRVASSPI